MALRRDPDAVPTARLVEMAGRGPQRQFFRLTALRALGKRTDAAAQQTAMAALSAQDIEQVQVAVGIQTRRPKTAAVPQLVTLLSHVSRPVRVDAAYALARLGARGAPEQLAQAYKDALAMLDRQRHFVHDLQKIAVLADAAGDVAAANRYFDEMLRISKWGTRGWPLTAVELLQRRGRNLADAGKHKEAVETYAQARSLFGEDLPPLLFIDSADSLAEVGRLREAAGIWNAILSRTSPRHPLHVMAKARLAGRVTPELEAQVAAMADDPVSGELLRRVRWALDKLKKP